MTHRSLALLASLLLAGCASVDSEQAIATARDWSQRIDDQAPQLRTETAHNRMPTRWRRWRWA